MHSCCQLVRAEDRGLPRRGGHSPKIHARLPLDFAPAPAPQTFLNAPPIMSLGSRLAGALTLIAGSIAAASTGSLDKLVVNGSMDRFINGSVDVESGVVGVAVLASLAILWPIVGPFLEIKQLAGARGGA
jgi:hypothetical protein